MKNYKVQVAQLVRATVLLTVGRRFNPVFEQCKKLNYTVQR